MMNKLTISLFNLINGLMVDEVRIDSGFSVNRIRARHIQTFFKPVVYG